MSFKKMANIAGWIVFGISLIVYFFSVERTGSLWDCGEFVLGAYKLQVVHPPGAPLFLLVGRLFAWVGDITSSDPSNIAFAVNMMSAICTAFTATLVAWSTAILSKLALVGREGTLPQGEVWAASGAGLVAGLATAFSTSIWFSAVEGEVYAMSTFFTALTFWAVIKWYYLPDDKVYDKWLVFAVYSAGLSVGVHLLSLLTFPALAIFYYFKKYKKHTLVGVGTAAVIGAVAIALIQKVIIAGLPTLWSKMELLMVNSLGMPFHTGLVPTILIVAGLLYVMWSQARKRKSHWLEMLSMATIFMVISYTSFGMVVIRANANTPVNMNNPRDAMRLLPYLNREQYGERPLLKGAHFEAQPVDYEKEDRYGRVGDKYEVVDQKVTYKYQNKDKILFPRIGHQDQGRVQLHKRWMNYLGYDNKKTPGMGYNLAFLRSYQLGWMYWRYFAWNFIGRENGEQGYFPWDVKNGHWLSGVKFVDESRLYNQDKLTDAMKNHKARNTYYFLPFIFGLIGMFFHFKHNRNDFLGLLAMFIITGIGIVIYSNQPPNEPRERDYVLVGSFFTFCIWMGMAVPFIFKLLRDKVNIKSIAGPALATALVLTAPIIMGFQNYDDHSRMHHKAARDYAANFLNSLEKDAVLFTYGDNDTYPLWYAQEVENIRPDVRVINLSLIAVDWYINQVRRKVNESPPIKMTIPEESYRGKKRNSVLYFNKDDKDPEMPLQRVLQFIGEQHPVQGGTGQKYESYLPTRNLYIPVDINAAVEQNMIEPQDSAVVDKIPINLTKRRYITKDDLAVLDIIGSNIWERPIYFSVTCQESKLLGLQPYMQLEGLALRIIPIRSKSDKSYYIYGSGRVAEDKVYDNVMNKFRWGNFDKYDTYVDRSYMPAVQAQRMIIMRAAEQFIRNGEGQKAVDLADKFFSSFPNFNFTYDAKIIPILGIYERTGQAEKLKKELSVLAENLRQEMEFYESLDEEIRNKSFRNDYGLARQSIGDVLRLARSTKDDDFFNQVNQKIGGYVTQQVPN